MPTKTPAWIRWSAPIAGTLLLGAVTWFTATFFAMRDDLRDLRAKVSNTEKFWKLHRWETSQINKLRVKAGWQPTDWPDLDKGEDETP